MAKVKADAYGLIKESIDFWSTNRNTLSQLYPSEMRFFQEFIDNVDSVIDVGCAVGGMSEIIGSLNSDIEYTGIDISKEMVLAAREKYHSRSFNWFDGKRIPDKFGIFDGSLSYGVLHHVDEWQSLIKSMFAISRRSLLFDVRCSFENSIIGNSCSVQKVCDTKAASFVSYNIINFAEFLQFVRSLLGPRDTCSIYGYEGRVTDLATTPIKEAFMLAVLIKKDASKQKISIELE